MEEILSVLVNCTANKFIQLFLRFMIRSESRRFFSWQWAKIKRSIF